MTKVYNTLMDEEYNVLNDIASATGMDCWFSLKQDNKGIDYVYDIEERKRMCLKTGVSQLAEGISCIDDYSFSNKELDVFKGLLQKLNISI